MTDLRPTVLVYRSRILPRSETFIKRQIKALSRWNGVLIGEPMGDGLPLGDLPHHPVKIPRKVASPRWPERLFKRWRPQSRLDELPSFARAKFMSDVIRKSDWFSVLDAMKPTVLHVHFGTNAEEAWPIAIALNIPMVVTLHGYDASIYDAWWESGHGGKQYRRYPSAIRAMSDRGTNFIAVSDAIADDAIQRGINPLRIRKIPIGVEIPERDHNNAVEERIRRVLFVGRFVEKKGLEYLLRSFSGVRLALPDVELRIIGDGPLGPQLRELVAEQNLPVEFLGWQTEETVMAEMREARVLCVPSIRAANGDAEGLPTVILEAQAAGLPVVTSARGAAMEGIIDGVTGIAVPEGAILELTNALVRVLSDNAFVRTASAEARVFAEKNLDIGRHVDTLEAFYDEVAGDAAISKQVWFDGGG